jgi:phthiodiolone/phenolphthiodiolone dimycocerosates ketoreductase
MNTDLAKAFALLLPDSEWKKHGYDHPFGDGFHSLTGYIPMRYDKATTQDAINQVPKEVLQDFYMTGDAESIIKQLEVYVHQGLDHIILWNSTGMFDLAKTKSSYGVMKEVLAYVKG